MNNKLIIGVTGGTGSGKTTFTTHILDIVGEGKVAYIQQDCYYKDRSSIPYEKRKDINYDAPDSFENNLLISHLNELIEDRCIEKPVYDFKTHTRKEEVQVVYPRDVIVLEGILILHEHKLRKLIDLKIFLDIEAEIRLCRRIQRDAVDRKRDVNSVIDQWLRTVKPMYDRYVAPTKKYADIIYTKDPSKSEIKILFEKMNREL